MKHLIKMLVCILRSSTSMVESLADEARKLTPVVFNGVTEVRKEIIQAFVDENGAGAFADMVAATKSAESALEDLNDAFERAASGRSAKGSEKKKKDVKPVPGPIDPELEDSIKAAAAAKKD